MSEDINNYNEEQLIKSLEDNKGIKTIKRKQCLGRSNTISLKEENGTHIHDQIPHIHLRTFYQRR